MINLYDNGEVYYLVLTGENEDKYYLYDKEREPLEFTTVEQADLFRNTLDYGVAVHIVDDRGQIAG